MTDSLSKSIKSTDHELSWANRGLKGNSAEDVKELCDAIEKFAPLVALRLEGNTINEAAATAIGEALEKHPELERLIWNDLFTTRLKTEVPPSLIKLTQGLLTNGAHIVEINLSDNAFGPIGVEGLKAFLSSSACFTLEELRLNNCGMGIGGGKLLAEALIKCHENSIQSGGRRFQLKQFVAGRNRLENEGAQALAQAFEIIGTLEVIRTPQNGIRPPGIEALAKAFLHNPRLRTIDLNDNTITLAAGKLASSIEKLPNLEVINLESSLIRTKGALAVARALVSHKNLQELYFGCNDINTEGGLEIAHAVKNMPNLRILDLNGNCFGNDGVDEISQVLESTSFANQMNFDDDEGSEVEDDEENANGDEEEQEEDEYGEEDGEGDDDEYEDYDEDENEDDEQQTPAFSFSNPLNSGAGFKNFQFGVHTSQADNKGTDLSSMISTFNICSPFSFGSKATTGFGDDKWTKLMKFDQMRDHLKLDEETITRAIQIVEDLWNDSSLSLPDTKTIAENVFKAVPMSPENERQFNERLLVLLGFVKDEKLGRARKLKQKRDRIFRILLDVHTLLPRSSKNIVSIFVLNASDEQSQCSAEIKQELLTKFRN